MNFDDTYTDSEFESALADANQDLFTRRESREPDLSVEGLSGSIISRLLALFSGG